MLAKVIDKLRNFKYDGNNLEELEAIIGIRTSKGINLAGTDILRSALQSRFADDPRLEEAITLVNNRAKEYQALITTKDAGDVISQIIRKGKPVKLVGSEHNIVADENRVFSHFSYKESKASVCRSNDWFVNEHPNAALSYFSRLVDNQKLVKNKIYSQIIVLLFSEMKVLEKNDIVIMPKAISRVMDKCGEIELASQYAALQPFVTANNKLTTQDLVCSALNDEYKIYKKAFKMNGNSFNVYYVLKKKNLKESMDRRNKIGLKAVK